MTTPIGRSTLLWQSAGMQKLRQQHPDSFVGGAVFHGCNLSPDVVLSTGIPARGGQLFDIAAHQKQWTDPGQTPEQKSALRGSCLAPMVPAGFAGEGGWVYKLYPVGGGIDVNRALGELHVDLLGGKLLGSVVPGETEIAIGSAQPPCQVESYARVGSYSELHECYRLGPWTPNPGFQPGGWNTERIAVTGAENKA